MADKMIVNKWRLQLRPRNVVVHDFNVEELRALSSLDQILDYCLKSAKLVGAGYSRAVFDLGDTVLKVARTKTFGISNRNEKMQADRQPQLFPDIVDFGGRSEDGRLLWIRSEKVQLLTQREFAQRVGASFDEVFSLLVWTCMKACADENERQVWRDCKVTNLRCSVPRVLQLEKIFMGHDSIAKRFIDQVVQFTRRYDPQERPYAIFDLAPRNVAWSEKKKAIVILDAGDDEHNGLIIQKSKVTKKRQKILDAINSKQLTSEDVLASRRDKKNLKHKKDLANG